ncbi:signal peptidase II [Acidaminococcus fermentans]|uniref:signal peptidase II n=1 Tax=Acidaminococcus fermentans TaxID=905 RepID=UPI002430690C|nr:signal peptidase II [Acidaminococcus fermentans]
MLTQIFLVVLLDRITKSFITHTMTVGMSIPVIPGIVSCTYVLNPGAAFGLLEYKRAFFVAITLAAAGAIFLFRDHIHREGPKARLGTGLFLGGALGNLIDRIATGYVIDFVDFHFWPVFNVADIFICLGVGLIVWSMLENENKKDNRLEKPDGSRKEQS